VGVPTPGSSGAPGGQASAGAPAASGGSPFNTGVGGAFVSNRAGAPGAGGAKTGAAGAPPVSGSCAPAAGTITELLIDDLDDGDDAIRPIGARVGYWYTYNDGTTGAVQIPAPSGTFKGTAPGHSASAFAAVTSGPAFTTYGAGMGFSFHTVGNTACPYDASAYKGITFWAKANAGNAATMTLTAMLKTPATTPVANGGTCAAMCEDHYALKPAPTLTTTWAQHTITFATASTATFGQNNFGTVVPFDKAKIMAMQFQVAKGVKFDFSIDDITFF
jgi:hypothetical protein